MFELSKCTRDNFCFECDNEKCLHHGKIEADCPKYRCNMPDEINLDCEKCPWIKRFIEKMKADTSGKVQNDKRRKSKAI